jgi:hypothetical protein
MLINGEPEAYLSRLLPGRNTQQQTKESLCYQTLIHSEREMAGRGPSMEATAFPGRLMFGRAQPPKVKRHDHYLQL